MNNNPKRLVHGDPVDVRPRTPFATQIAGPRVHLERLSASFHGPDLYAYTASPDNPPELWDYMSVGPFPEEGSFQAVIEHYQHQTDPWFYAIRDLASDHVLGMASYLNIVPVHGSIEIGHIMFGPDLQRTAAATEALYLMMRHAFEDLGYRRLEWKCNALNEPSRRAALRLGFTFEGIFYRHLVVKGRNRDTAWYSMLAEEWSDIRPGFEKWLSPDNFDESGRQRISLQKIMKCPG